MSLNEGQKNFIKKEYKIFSARRLAKDLRISRSEVEKYIEILLSENKESISAGRLITKMPKWSLLPLLFFLTMFTYANSINYEFVWDDKVQIVHNPQVKDFSLQGFRQVFSGSLGENKSSGNAFNAIFLGNKKSSYYRPIQMSTYIISNQLFGLNPKIFHITNILLQCAAVLVLFLLLRLLLKDQELAFWVAAFFAVHPAQIAAVTYVSGRAETIAFIFMALAFILFYKGLILETTLKKGFNFAISAFFLLASILSKELMLISPVLFLIYMLIFNFEKKKISIFIILNVLTISIYFYLRWIALNEFGGSGSVQKYDLLERIANAFMALIFYIKLIFFPVGLHMGYKAPQLRIDDPLCVLGIICALILIALVWFSRKNPISFFGWMWFFIFLFPILNIFTMLSAPWAEHWIYNAVIGFFIVGLEFFLRVDFKSNFLNNKKEPFLLILLLVLSITTFSSNRVWKDGISVFENVLKYEKRAEPGIYFSLSYEYSERGMNKKAKDVIDRANKIFPDYPIEITLHETTSK